MVRNVDEKIVTVEHAQGGAGSIEFHHLMTGDELLGHARLFAKVVIKPHSSIGMHKHVDETEPYFIIKGEGVFVDNDGTRTTVRPGDVCLIDPGQSHSIENNTDEELWMVAIVLYDKGINK